MAHGGYETIPDWDPYDDNPDDDDNADQTTPFSPNGASTPYQTRPQEEMKMGTFKKKSGRPETSYAETSFGGTEDLERRLANLRRNNVTGLLNTEGIPSVGNPLTETQKAAEVQRVREFIRKKYPRADFKKMVLGFSRKKPMDIVIKGPRGDETKVVKDNGSGLQQSFLNLTYVKRALGKSFEEIQKENIQQLAEERKKLNDLVEKSPEKVELIDSLKDKISKKETEKKKKKKIFTAQNRQNKLKS